jgi:hypothetical protein
MFIGSSSEGRDVAKAMEQNLWVPIQVKVWEDDDIFKPTRGTLESLAEAVNSFDFGAFVLSADDASLIRSKEVSVVRDNVVLEAGMFIGRLGRDRVFLLTPNKGDVHLPTDLLGAMTLMYDTERDDNGWKSATSPACTTIMSRVAELGGVRSDRGIVAYGDRVTISTCNGCYVQIGDEGWGRLKAVSRDYGNWDKLEIISADGALVGRPVKFGDKIGLRAVRDALFVRAELNEGTDREVAAQAKEMWDWEKFRVCPTNSGTRDGTPVAYGTSLALRAHDGKFVAYAPEDTCQLRAVGEQNGLWERLMFVEPE